MNTQVHELGLLRRSFYDLENQHVQLRKQYEEEAHRLRSEMSRLRGTRPVSRSGSLLNNSNIPSDIPDNGRDRVHMAREQRIQMVPMPPLVRRTTDPERDTDRLTDHRSAKRLKSRPDQTENSPIRTESPSKQSTINTIGPLGLTVTSTSPKSALLPAGDCPTGIGPNQFQEVQNDGNWSVVHNPKVPKVLDVYLLHTFTHGRYVIRHTTFLRERLFS